MSWSKRSSVYFGLLLCGLVWSFTGTSFAQPVKTISPAEGQKSADRVYLQVTCSKISQAQIFLNEAKACDAIPCQFAVNHGIYKLKAIITQFDEPIERESKIMAKKGLKVVVQVRDDSRRQLGQIEIGMTDAPVSMETAPPPTTPPPTASVPTPAAPPPLMAPAGPVRFIPATPSEHPSGTKVRVEVAAKNVQAAQLYLNETKVCDAIPCTFDTNGGVYQLKSVVTQWGAPVERINKIMVKAGIKSALKVTNPQTNRQEQINIGYSPAP
jgi:hypothetical protein